jgi:hypothetical protein
MGTSTKERKFLITAKVEDRLLICLLARLVVVSLSGFGPREFMEKPYRLKEIKK